MSSHNERFIRLEILDNAVEKLKQSITAVDAVVFRSVTVQDVWTAIREIQQEQRDRQSIQNLTRMKPLIDGLEKYSKVLEVLCNGTPYMPWIWAPIKLMLQLANEYHNIFEKLLIGYVRIGEALPRFDRFQDAFEDIPAFQAIVFRVFEDIVEFHRRVYKFFRRRAWHIFFESLWTNFDSRFDGILESLKMSRDLIDQEALAIDIVEARAWRQKAEADAQEREKRARIVQLQGAIAWLAVEGLQEDELDQLVQSICPGTANWIVSHHMVKTWMLDDEGEPILWLRGIPGGGKSVLSARIVQYLQDETDIPTLYFFCSHYICSKKLCSEVLRALISQLLRFNQDHALFVYNNHIQKASSMVQLRAVLRDLLTSMPHSRIVIDGLDECQEADRKAILGDLSKLTTMPETSCKLLVSARDNGYASRPLRKMPTLCLTAECASLNSDIRIYVESTMAEILQEDRFQGKSIEGIKESVLNRGQGMFLWVKVVMEEMRHCQCILDLRQSVRNLQEGLYELYKLILKRMESELRGVRRDQAVRVLQWITVSYRPLRIYEIQDGVSIRPGQSTLDENTKLPISVIDVCRPLIQIRRDGVIEFVHFSVRDDAGGLLVNELLAQRNITYSCVAYLATSLSLVSEHVPLPERRLRILCGLHGLHHYAHAFWIEHFLRYAQLVGSLDTTDSEELLAQIRKLLAFKKDDWSVRVTKHSVKVEPLKDDLARLSVLSTAPDIESFVPQIRAFQQVLVQEDNKGSQNDLRDYKLEHDPTYFTDILHFYQTTVELFLQPLDSENLEGYAQGLVTDFLPHWKERSMKQSTLIISNVVIPCARTPRLLFHPNLHSRNISRSSTERWRSLFRYYEFPQMPRMKFCQKEHEKAKNMIAIVCTFFEQYPIIHEFDGTRTTPRSQGWYIACYVGGFMSPEM